jgi:hypothetical protein
MRVDPTGVQPPIRPTTGTAARPADKAGDASASAAAAGADGTFTPTAELARLLTAVAESPDVRTEVIESVAARLANGEFDTPEAAADAARVLLDSAE